MTYTFTIIDDEKNLEVTIVVDLDLGELLVKTAPLDDPNAVAIETFPLPIDHADYALPF